MRQLGFRFEIRRQSASDSVKSGLLRRASTHLGSSFATITRITPRGATRASAVRSPSVNVAIRSISLRSQWARTAGAVLGSRATSTRSCQPRRVSASQAKCLGQRECLTSSLRSLGEPRIQLHRASLSTRSPGQLERRRTPASAPSAGLPPASRSSSSCTTSVPCMESTSEW